MTTGAYRWPDSPRPPVLHLAGELDIDTSAELITQLRDHASHHEGSVLVVDLSHVSFMDSSGLDPLAQAYDALAAADRLLVAQSLAPAVRRFFQLINTCRRVALVEQTLRDRSDRPGRLPHQAPEVKSLSVLVRDLSDAVRDSAEIEQAKGLLMGVHGCDAEQAGMLLALIAHRRHITVHDLAVARVLVLPDVQATASAVLDGVGGTISHEADL